MTKLHEMKLEDQVYGRAKVLVVPFAAELAPYVRGLKSQTYTNVVLVPDPAHLPSDKTARMNELTKFAMEVAREIRIELTTNKDTSFPQDAIWVGGTGQGFFSPVYGNKMSVEPVLWTYIPQWTVSTPESGSLAQRMAEKTRRVATLAKSRTLDALAKVKQATRREEQVL